VRENEARVILDHTKFIEAPKAIQRRLLRQAVSRLLPDLRNVGYEVVELGLDFANDPSQSGEIDLVARLNIAKLADCLIIKTWESDLPDWQMPLLPTPDTEIVLDIGKPVALRHGWLLEADLINKASDELPFKPNELDPDETWLDYDQIEMPLHVRGRRPGDRWQPLGMQNHTQKLKDFFINEKISEHLRDVWPLVSSEGEIAWVVGLRPSEIYKITQKTKRILHLKLIRKIA
jgi:tRNA(Ile)-lysidine synthase